VTTYLIVSSFLNFAAAAVLAFAVALRGRRGELNLRFGVFAVCVAAWSAGYFLWQLAPDAGSALVYSRLLMLPAYLVPAAYLHFVMQLCGEPRKIWLRVAYGVAFACLALGFSPLMVRDVMPEMDFPHWPVAGPLFAVYLVLFASCTAGAVGLMARHLRDATGARASQLKYILVATLVGFPGGATNFPLWYGVQVPPLGNGLIFLYLVIMAHAVTRYQLPLATYDFVHAAVYIGMAATFGVIFLFVRVLIATLEGATLASGTLLNNFLLGMVGSLFFLWAVPRLKAGADRIVEQTYLRRRRGQRGRLESLAQQVCSIGAEEEIFETTAREVAGAMDVAHLGLFIRGDLSDRLDLRASQGWGADGFTREEFSAGSALARALARGNAPLIFDGSELVLPEEELAAVEGLRATMPFEAVFPVLTEGALLGALVLGPRGGHGGYLDRDIALLEAICLQIAVTLRARQLERRANQAEKLISLGTLAAGLAHELRNPLVSIRTFTSLMEEQGADAEFRREFHAVVERDVRRIGAIIDHVSAFAQDSRVKFTAVRVDEVVQAVYDIARPEFARAGVAFAAPPAGLPAVHGNYGQLLQVFLNLFQNAIHALDGRPAPRVEVRAQVAGGEGDARTLVLAVADNGAGIEPALLPRVFDPFVSTKATGDGPRRAGMGLGLALVKRIIEGHRGAITVTSEPGRGTTFYVHLPCLP
jgi:two-component system nitrogen regulation sensor histidine kinase GlnL